ncbi:MAG: aerotolerance regulator BatA [Anaerolineae bacterium]|nr:VWA domain-containing protein [Anaerolineales bacterium]MCQ3976316.1 aerotolerance regulator BatA [Anaerolineae bacterium]
MKKSFALVALLSLLITISAVVFILNVNADEKTNIVIVLDISGSMAAEDFNPNRLEAAKGAIQNFIDNRQDNPIGFITFAGEIASQVTLTLDHEALKQAISETQLAWNIGLDSGTAIGLGLDHAINMLHDLDANNRVIILLTDGANNAGEIDPLVAAQVAQEHNIRIYTVGVAKEGLAKLTFPDGRVEYRDNEIDEETLKKIAEVTGGQYFRVEDIDRLREAYDKISELEYPRKYREYRETKNTPSIPVPIQESQHIPVIQVIVASQDIKKGSPLVTNSTHVQDWPITLVVPDTIIDETEIISQVAKIDIVQGQVITRGMLTGSK